MVILQLSSADVVCLCPAAITNLNKAKCPPSPPPPPVSPFPTAGTPPSATGPPVPPSASPLPAPVPVAAPTSVNVAVGTSPTPSSSPVPAVITPSPPPPPPPATVVRHWRLCLKLACEGSVCMTEIQERERTLTAARDPKNGWPSSKNDVLSCREGLHTYRQLSTYQVVGGCLLPLMQLHNLHQRMLKCCSNSATFSVCIAAFSDFQANEPHIDRSRPAGQDGLR